MLEQELLNQITTNLDTIEEYLIEDKTQSAEELTEKVHTLISYLSYCPSMSQPKLIVVMIRLQDIQAELIMKHEG